MSKKFDFSILRNLRKKLGITAEQLAERAGLTRATVAKIEGGKANPTMGTIEALAGVFQLTPSELVRVAEATRFEKGKTKSFKTKGFSGKHIWFPQFEVYFIKAKAGVRKESIPELHENTAEVCLVLSGKLNLTVGGQTHKLGAGMAARFKAMQDHWLDIIEDSEFLLIHHSAV